jgi:collagenase-like PrtC family protease
MKISLGPIQYFWPKNKVIAFYKEIAETPVDIVYLGETICYKRHELRLRDWMEIGRELSANSKTIVLSTLALLEAAAELHSLRKVCENGEFLVEANDIAAISLLSETGLPFVAGPSINIYNNQTIRYFQQLGMIRWVMPVELGRDTLQQILSGLETPIETEIFCYGKMPLAYSARCFTARAHNLPKDRCDLKCRENPDGLLLESQEQQTLFTINGIQTQSGDYCDLRPQWQEMDSIGVDIMRISPQSEGTATIAHELCECIQNNKLPKPANREVCNGYWFGQSGLEFIGSPE